MKIGIGRVLRQRMRMLMGIIGCCLLLGGFYRGLTFQTTTESTVMARAWEHLSINELRVTARFPKSSNLHIGCRILVGTDKGLRIVGSLDTVKTVQGDKIAQLLIFPDKSHFLHSDSAFTSYRTASDVAWVVQTLIPPEHLDVIKQRLLVTWKKERSQLWDELKPGLIRLLEELGTVLKDEFPALIESHVADMNIMSEVLRERSWEEHLEPVFVSTIWPLMEERAAPIISSVGDEIIEEAPVWSLYWAYLRQKVSSDANPKHLEKRVGEFLSEKAVPIIRRHSTEFRETLRTILFDLLKNETVQIAVQESIMGAASDPRFRKALSTVLEQWVLKSTRVRAVLEGALKRPDVATPLTHIMDSFERDIHHIANLILLNDTRDGINPDLARVLRSRLLREDESWILLTPGSGSSWSGEALQGQDGGTR